MKHTLEYATVNDWDETRKKKGVSLTKRFFFFTVCLLVTHDNKRNHTTTTENKKKKKKSIKIRYTSPPPVYYIDMKIYLNKNSKREKDGRIFSCCWWFRNDDVHTERNIENFLLTCHALHLTAATTTRDVYVTIIFFFFFKFKNVDILFCFLSLRRE